MDVAWETANVSRQHYVLRNVGTATAHDVTLSGHPSPELIERWDTERTVPPGQVIEFAVRERDQLPTPTKLIVGWRGQRLPVEVPIGP